MRMNCAIFDMDGTLVDSMWKWDQQNADVLRHFGAEPRPDFNDVTRPMGVMETAKYCCETYHLTCTPQDVMDEMYRAMSCFYANEVKAKPGVEKVLSLLKMEGVTMYVATATDLEFVKNALRCAGIADYFKGIITVSEVGISKTKSARVFEYAMKRMRGNKLNTVIFEDSWAAIRQAKAEGFRVAGIYDASMAVHWEEIKAMADYAFESWEEMTE